MTSEQINNFRKILKSQLGPYVDLMSDSDIINYRNRIQENIDSFTSEEPEPENVLSYYPFSNLKNMIENNNK
jgi:hypothetical protein